MRDKAAKAVIWSVIQKWGTQVISFLTFLVLSRLLEPKVFGLVAMANVFIAFVEIFLDQGFSDAIVQRSELEPEHLDTAFWTSLLSATLLALVGIFIAEHVAILFHEPQLTLVIQALSLSLPIIALSSTQQAILRRQLAFKSLTLRSLTAAIVGGSIGMSMAFLGFGVWSLVVQILIDGLVAAIVLWKVSNWQPKFNFSYKHFQDLFSFGANVTGIKILDFFNRRSDDFLIGYFLGSVALGYYTVAYRLLLVMIKLLTGVTTSVAFPTFSRLQMEPERMRRAFYQVTKYTSLISFPIFLGFLIIAPELVLALFGSKWSPSIPVMQVLSLIGILLSVSYFNNTVIKAVGEASWLLKIMLLNSVCNVLAFLFVVKWGILAVASAYVAIGYLLFPISLIAVAKLININFITYIGQYITPMIASLLMISVMWGLKFIAGELNLYLQIIIYVLAGISSYIVVITVLDKSIAQQTSNFVRILFKKSKDA
ncbi:putative polysaccharide transport protein [Calothrix sp. NIES-2100]|uniref:lipopolysaccharide biosynthesis protein n=1 Tax=Calothrix sp. NIES-2100 TaxID=1954172 RepID=UPI000B5FAABC|nr:putative polysaccharide transport protein [Calothrix sp. NIES-2100]